MSSTAQLLAFEYVAGTLRGAERSDFEAQVNQDAELQQWVNFWEQELLGLQDLSERRALSTDLWPSIASRINKPTQQSKLSWWYPAAITAAFVVMVATILLFSFSDRSISSMPIDYVAVLLDEQGEPKLTAMTQGEKRQLLLQWQSLQIPERQNLQLWAESKSDGQIRSLAVITKTDLRSLSLSDAHWRLIKDAGNLILTIEESGGSPIDEPSDQVIARGVCVRVSS